MADSCAVSIDRRLTWGETWQGALDEIRALCQHCTVLRGGRVTGEVDPRTVDNAALSRLMIGSEPPRLRAGTREVGAPVLRVQGRLDELVQRYLTGSGT